MNALNLTAKNSKAKLHTYEETGPKFTTMAKDLETGTASQLFATKVAADAVIKHFSLCAKYNLTPYRD